ncbi:MAG: serine hydrolase [Solirubrobacteraceae bacterium]
MARAHRTHHRRSRHFALALFTAAALLASAPALGAAGPEVSASLSSSELPYGSPYTLSGRAQQGGSPIAGTPVALQEDPYPFAGFTTVAQASSAPDGSFSFRVPHADRNVRLRVLVGAGAGPTLALTVDPLAATNARSLGAGRALLSVRLTHTTHAPSTPVQVSWFVAPRGTHAFHLATVNPTREIAAGVTYGGAVVDPPATHFIYRVCLTPSWKHAMDAPASHTPCPRGALEYGGEGRGTPATPYPSASAIASASSFLAERAGRTSFAVVDSTGRLSGLHLTEHFETASVVKVMMLTAFLQMRSAQHRSLDAADRALLYPMIHISDNEAASAVYGIVGESAVARVARESDMSDYAPGVGWWAFDQTSAADQARFFLALPHLIPAQFYAYARGLLAGIEPSQSWGAPPVARAKGWQIFFKTGALPSQGLFNEVARLERPGVTFTLAVFTDGDPSMAYGEQTIEGVTARLLAHSP